MPRPIVIATLMRPNGATGVQTHVRAFMAYLHAAERECSLLTPYDAPLWQVYPLFAVRRLIDLFSLALGVRWYRHWHAYFLRQALGRKLRAGHACTVYAQCPLSAQAALRARVSAEQRVVMVAHFNISQADEWADKGAISRGGRYFRSIRALEQEILPRLDGLVFVSEFMRREVAGRIPAVGNVATSVLPNFLPDPGLPPGKPVVADLINIGTLEPRKNQQYLLDIVAVLRQLGQPLTLTLVGDGPDRGLLEQKARALGIQGQVCFAGHLANAGDEIGRHRAYIHVATMESFGITLIEAMARGRPVFATPVGGVSEVLGEGAAGHALPLNDARGAALIVAEAMGDPRWMAEAGAAARARFLGNYASDLAAGRLARFLDNQEAGR